MENTNVQEVKMPITYDDLKKSLVDSGRPYDFAMIDRAYALAEKAHGEQRRRSGEPYICHPLSVAQILVELGMDSESIAAALMHDVAEDTPVTVAEIKQKFGPEVALLVDGVTKLTQIKFSNVEDRQAENLRKMLLAMSQDVRVMIIKLCDRLHNMRTGDAWPEQKRRDKALETMEVYAPIAHRLGISNIKEELEDRSLHYLDPVGYETIRDLLNKHGDEFLHQVCHTIARHLSENGIQKATIRHRVKSIYGIYRKMYMQNKDFEEIYDIYAVRIILDNVPECYTALGLIHDMYHPLPNRFKDYISTPKPNGYQSLHTTVIGREAIPFEVQIRTWDMDRMAEYGIAAHWKYKAGITGSSDKLDERLAWVRQLLESQRSSADATDLLSDIKSDLLPEEVFAFTPRGDVINLPAGATAIDFAYAIHSAVGNRMIGAKVNNRIVPIDHKVQTGEIIEIITGSENRGPSRDWLNIVKTSEAKNKIRNWFKKERREENIQEGRDALEREMRRNLMTLTDEQHDVFMEALAAATAATAWRKCTRPSATAACRSPACCPSSRRSTPSCRLPSRSRSRWSSSGCIPPTASSSRASTTAPSSSPSAALRCRAMRSSALSPAASACLSTSVTAPTPARVCATPRTQTAGSAPTGTRRRRKTTRLRWILFAWIAQTSSLTWHWHWAICACRSTL